MAGRPVQKKANIEGLQQMVVSDGKLVNLRPAIALIMFYSGCTYNEIAQVFYITRQMAETVVNKAKAEL